MFFKNRGKKNNKKVIWNGEIFESLADLARKLRVSPPKVTDCVRNEKELKGHIPILISKKMNAPAWCNFCRKVTDTKEWVCIECSYSKGILD